MNICYGLLSLRLFKFFLLVLLKVMVNVVFLYMDWFVEFEFGIFFWILIFIFICFSLIFDILDFVKEVKYYMFISNIMYLSF